MTNTDKKKWLERHGDIDYHHSSITDGLVSGSWSPYSLVIVRSVQGRSEINIIDQLFNIIRNEMFNRCNDERRR